MSRKLGLGAIALGLVAACAEGSGDSDRAAANATDDETSASTGGSTTGAGGSLASSSTGTASSGGGGEGGAGITTSGSGGAGVGGAGVGGAGVGGAGVGGAGVGGAITSSGSGGANGGLWIEIEYGSNSSPTSPTWDHSMTPGWSLQDWATSNETWPEVWDPLQGMTTNLDPMGYWAAIIDGEHLQLMIGLQNLVSYTDAIVRLEGRGYSTNASAQIDVYNPLNNCGVSTSMAHDWSLHVVEVSLGSCLVPGGGVQAIRVAPTSQGLALHRMRLTIEGAVF